MILGTGLDMIEIARIRDSMEKFGSRFTGRIFTASEIAYCEQRKSSAESFAARFAAKEAAAKALGTGISRGVTWKEIEVQRAPGQRPTLHFSGRAELIAKAMGVRAAALTLTHSRELAVAQVILES